MDSQTFYKQTGQAIAAYLLQELNIMPGVHWKVRNATSGPRVLTFSILLNPRFASKIASMSEALSMAAGLDKEASIRIGRGNRGTLCLEIPKPASLWYNIGVSNLPKRRGLLASVGLDNEHRPALIDFSNPLTPHCLAAGATGSGKTNVARLLVYDLAAQNTPDQVSLVLIDTRKRAANWRDFANVPHLGHPVITDDETALRALSWACAEIDRRAESGRTKPATFFCIDESQDLLDREEFVKVIGDIAGTGREFGIHLLAAMQNPTAKQLGDTSIKRNLTTRLVGRVDSATAAVVATGQADSGAEKLTGAGDFLLVEPAGIKRLTAALLTEKDTAKLPRAEQMGTLDLSQYEDVDHVLSQADNEGKAGRPEDPMEPQHLAFALVYPDASLNEFYRQFSIRKDKAKRVIAYAQELLAELLELGHCVAGTERNEIESKYHFLDVTPENDSFNSVPSQEVDDDGLSEL